jgi:endogenous inhibitor of DNA gyrase (YacG/DUF329 family)
MTQPASPSSPSGARPAPLVPCPTCGNKTLFSPANPWRPFCSERCKNHDLGAWASESYRVPASAPPDTENDGQP